MLGELLKELGPQMVSQILSATGLYPCLLALTEKNTAADKLLLKSHAKYSCISLGTEACAFEGSCLMWYCGGAEGV